MLVEESTLIKKLVFRIVRKHIAGSTINSALELSKSLNSKGISTTLTFLNDQITDSAKAKYNLNSYVQLVKQVSRLSLKSSVSLRLTQLGLNLPNNVIDGNMQKLIDAAKPLGVKLWIEYEDGIELARLVRKYELYLKSYDGIGIELPVRSSDIDSIISKLGNGRMLKLTTHYYRGKSSMQSEQGNIKNAKAAKDVKIKQKKAGKDKKPDKGPTGIYSRYISMLSGKKHTLYLLEGDEKIVYKILTDMGAYKKNLIFELPLGYNKKWQNRIMKKGANLDVYVPYGKDWTHYAINKLAEGRIRSIAATVLDGEAKKVSK